MTYTTEDFRGPMLIKLPNDDSHVIVLKRQKKQILKNTIIILATQIGFSHGI